MNRSIGSALLPWWQRNLNRRFAVTEWTVRSVRPTAAIRALKIKAKTMIRAHVEP
jgi:hypothetical protein